jgi:hypothetical protein
LTAQRSAIGAINQIIYPVLLGALNWEYIAQYDHFNGTMDDVRIYDKALTRQEIITDMNTPVANNSCTPDCVNKNCGTNGCDGSCGTCTGTLTCNTTTQTCQQNNQNCNNLCNPSTQTCNTATQTCENITTDACNNQCDQTIQYCDDIPGSQTFGQCITNTLGCTDDIYCSDLDPFTPYCNTNTGDCIQCKTANECETGETCDNGFCTYTAECQSDNECAIIYAIQQHKHAIQQHKHAKT